MTTDLTYRVHRCRSCGAAFTVPRPTPHQLEAFYEREYFQAASGFGYDDCCGTSYAAYNAGRLWQELGRWEPRLSAARPRSLLDVGCATGDLLAAAADDGWDVTGVEVSAWAREVVRARYRIAVAPTLDDVARPDGGVGLVTMFHVVEHLVDPLPTLRQVRGLISDEGVLVLEVPQWRSLGRLARGARWSQLRPPEHITFLDPRSMRQLLSRAGFEAVRLDTPYPSWRDRWASARGRQRWRVAPGALAARVAERAHLGGYMRVLAQPSGVQP